MVLAETPVRHALESFFKRRFFAVHLALLALAAILCARTATAVAGHFVAEQIKEKATAARPAEKRAPSRPVVTRDFEASANANIFEGRREVVVEQAAAAAETPADDGTCDTAGKSALRLRLVGTVVFSTPEYSLASIVDEGKGASSAAEMFSINECVSTPSDPEDPNAKLAPKPPPCSKVGDSATLRRVEAERVCIWNESDHRMELLFIDEPPEKGAVVARSDTPKAEAAPAATDDMGGTIKKTGENSYEVGQSDIDKALNNLSELSTQARIVPAFEGGKTIGFKLFSIRPGSLYSKVGLQNGDVITRINGYEMSSPEKGLEIYSKLKDAKSVNVDLKRRGKPLTLDYAITP